MNIMTDQNGELENVQSLLDFIKTKLDKFEIAGAMKNRSNMT